MKKILIDASSAILLFKAGLCELLFDVYQVVMTKSVFDELLQKDYPGSDDFQRWMTEKRFTIIQVVAQDNQQNMLRCQVSGLDKGELDTISLYEKGHGDFVITDDGRAAGYCKRYEIPFVNALLLPKVFYFSKRLPEHLCSQTMKFLSATGRYSPAIKNWALNCPKESLDFFLP
jgi:predicted nucleic acid-binding protein